MTLNELIRFIPVLEALKQCKKIQWKDQDGNWVDADGEYCVAPNIEFRVKPELRRFWVNIYPDNSSAYPYLYSSLSEALRTRDGDATTIMVQEVPDES